MRRGPAAVAATSKVYSNALHDRRKETIAAGMLGPRNVYRCVQFFVKRFDYHSLTVFLLQSGVSQHISESNYGHQRATTTDRTRLQ